MTKHLGRAIDVTNALPAEMQDEVARRMMAFMEEHQPLVALTPEEEAALDRSEAAAARGEFATDQQVAAIWAKHGLRKCAAPSLPRQTSMRF